ncbi:MAG: C13 family peptidase [Sphingorhabdus sp.]
MRLRMLATTLLIALILAGPSSSQMNLDNRVAAENGWSMEQNRSAAWHLAQHRRLGAVLSTLKPQRPGIVDAYVVSIGLDSDPVFGREAGEAENVLARRYGATERSVFLAAGADAGATGTPQGSPANLATALAAVAGRMNLKEDVLVFFATTHGDPRLGLVYRDGNAGAGMIAPKRLAHILDDLGIERRLIIISACFSGIFVPILSNENSVIVTAASSQRTSFGCNPGNDWTFFGDAFINTAMRKPQSLEKANDEARLLITVWEAEHGLVPSDPQISIGDNARMWLEALEARMPKTETAKVGRAANKAS